MIRQATGKQLRAKPKLFWVLNTYCGRFAVKSFHGCFQVLQLHVGIREVGVDVQVPGEATVSDHCASYRE
jgi:hypothetical protein